MYSMTPRVILYNTCTYVRTQYRFATNTCRGAQGPSSPADHDIHDHEPHNGGPYPVLYLLLAE